ncbi:MAG TPA: HEAT repeat domain-containing protein [Candidatus Krumholzibacteria bacterium]|nr:HEAT repeat domain-containing protein [Candidatus Krumholzibacteria bacterium]HPD70625.1 HEAT repeat domain-containing protein [Candidatus Krumholzibacteria bacterium]HRY39675.1 HEAT repeat domain-containing protein [Candidatus Krumholzibacteria bacterium]
MPHVFISYQQRTDLDFTSTVQRTLEKAGFAVWTDDEIQAGQAWQDRIDAAIREAIALVVILSPGATQSAYVNYEWAFALGAGVRVIPLLRKLSAGDLHARLRNLDVLDFSDDEARPWSELVDAVKAAADEVQQSRGKLRPGLSAAVQAAASALDSVRTEERDAALDSLEQMTDPAAVEALAGALAHPVVAVRRRAAEVLARRADPRALDVLVAGLRDPEAWESHGLWQAALGWLGPAAVPQLVRLCDDPDDALRASSVAALGAIDPRGQLDRLVAACADPAADVRERAVRGLLGAANEARAAAALVDRATDVAANVRFAVAHALGDVDAATAFAPLSRLARTDASDDVRIAAIASLGKIRSGGAVEVLAEVADTEDGDRRRRCADALAESQRPEAASALLHLARDPESLVRRHAVRGLGRLAGEAATRALASLLDGADADTRALAVSALAERGDPAAVPSIVEAFARETDDGVLRAYVGALRDLRAAAAVPALARHLQHADRRFVEAVRLALDRIGTPEARQALAGARRARG